MDSTSKMGFNLPGGADGFSPTPLADNWKKLDGQPLLVKDSGKTGIWRWYKFADGTYKMYGKRSDPEVTCTIAMVQRWRSSVLTQSLPIAIQTIEYVNMQARNVGEVAAGNIHIETQAMMDKYTNNSMQFIYATDQNEGQYTSSNKWPKECYIEVRGTW